MRMSHFLGLRRYYLGLVIPLLLSGCASSSKPAVNYPPAHGSSFSIRVRPGDTLSEIAYRYQVKVEDLLALNTIYDRNFLAVGQILRVPAYGHIRDTRQRSVTSANARAGNGAADPAERGRIERASLPPPQVPATRLASGQMYVPVPHQRPVPLPQTAPRPAQQSSTSWLDWFNPADSRDKTQTTASSRPETKTRFLWPVSGPVIANFGQYPGGGRNDGINIGTQRGAPVRASAGGTVTYVGNELKGYGNLILIRHDNGYVTAYAHADAVIVERGQRVERGEIIGYAGMTGDVDRPQLHFELRMGTKPVDPKPYLTS